MENKEISRKKSIKEIKNNAQNTKSKKSKSNVKNIRRNNTKKSEKEGKKSSSSSVLLWAAFLALFGLVIGLSVLVYQKSEKQKNYVEANISIPVYKTDSHFSFNINAFNLSSSNEEYVFRIRNYKNSQIASKDLVYNILVQNPTDAVIKLTKGNSKKNLMVNQSSTILESQSFLTENKEDIYYYISVIKKGQNIDPKDLISVVITS